MPHLFRKCSGSKVRSMPPVTPAGALVGRDSEMALLTGLLREVARGRGSSVLIEGEPGIGKSALVRAAVAEAPDAGCQVFWGAGDELGQALPLLPFLDGLRVREPSTNPRRSSCWRLSRSSVLCGRPSWLSTTCSGPTRPASPCGEGWRGQRGRCRCCW